MSSPHPAPRGAGAPRWALLGSALLSLLCSVAFVLAPVHRPDAVYSWPTAPGDAQAVAIPVMLLEPAAVHATISCAAVRDAAPDTVLISTSTLTPAPGNEPLPGLRVSTGDDGDLRVTTGDTELDPRTVPAAGDCTFELDSTADRTVLRLDGEVVEEVAGDVRPAVAGVFSDAPDAAGLAVDVTADTVFQTSATVLKIVLALLALAALAVALVLLGRGDRRAAPAPAQLPAGVPPADPDTPSPRGSRPLRWLVDAVVVLVLAGWTVIGPLSPDDGYIAGIIHSRDANGFVGDVYRWFNAPEAPFGWFYEVMNLWSRISDSTVWMRVPSSLLGVLTWFLLSRGLLPRLGAFARRPAALVTAALAFGAWWLPINLGLRPEPWVAAGLVAVVVLVERGLARGRLLPIALALVVAAATLAVTPTGAVAFLPPVAALVPVLRLARRRVDAGLPTLTVVALAAAATTALLMFADQSLAAIRLANAIRADLPGALPWSQEPERWYLLVRAGDLQGSVARRVPVLLTLLAVVGIVLRRTRLPRPGRDVTDRLLTTAALSLVVLTFTPTKWTLHFGAFAAVGAALAVVAVHLFSATGDPGPAGSGGAPRRPDRTLSTAALTATTAALSAVLLVAAQAYAGWNQWNYVSAAAIPWIDMPPQLLGVSFSTLFLAGSVLVALVGAGLVVAARSRGATEVRVPGARLLPPPGLVLVAVLLLTVLLQLGSFAKSTVAQRDTYTLAGDAAATVSGEPCGLAEDLRAEPDPTAGLLPAADVRDRAGDGPATDGFTATAAGAPAPGPALRMAGTDLPGWSATGHRSATGAGPATLTTEWFAVSDSQRAGDGPLVVTVTGDRGTGTEVRAEFGTVRGGRVTDVDDVEVPEAGGGPGPRDSRIDLAELPEGAGVVRLVVTDGGPDTDVPLAVSVPRIPVTVPFQQLVDQSSPALVDWPVAFLFPCQELGVQAAGLTDVPRWRISAAAPNDAGDIIVKAFVGGPYTAARTLVDQDEVPVYQRARPLDRPISLIRWTPRTELADPRVTRSEETVSGWSR